MTEILNRLERIRVVPVIAIEDLDHALPLADALLEGGLPVAEITFRTEAAVEVIARLHEKRPELLIGAGTVLTVTQLTQARGAWAAFALSPGVDPTVVAEAVRAGFPFYPGVMTPSDVLAGLGSGASFFKFFPAVPAGGLAMMRAILAPFAHLKLRVIPTGGVTPQDLREWLAEPAVSRSGGRGSHPAKRSWPRTGRGSGNGRGRPRSRWRRPVRQPAAEPPRPSRAETTILGHPRSRGCRESEDTCWDHIY